MQLWGQPFPYTSSDSQYAAQNANEVRTYEDLAMTYELIDQPYLRRQLRLPDDTGLAVAEAKVSGEGYKNGFRDGDIILQVADKPVRTQYDFVIKLSNDRGDRQDVKIRRDGEPLQLQVVLTKTPETDDHYLIGVTVEELSDLVKAQLKIENGVSITAVAKDSAAEVAGLQVNDVIVALNGSDINSLNDLKQIVQQAKDQPIDVKLIRSGKQRTLKVTPKKMDNEAVVVPGQNLPLMMRIPVTSRFMVHPRFDFKLEPATPPTSSEEASADGKILKKLDELEAKIDRLAESLK